MRQNYWMTKIIQDATNIAYRGHTSFSDIHINSTEKSYPREIVDDVIATTESILENLEFPINYENIKIKRLLEILGNCKKTKHMRFKDGISIVEPVLNLETKVDLRMRFTFDEDFKQIHVIGYLKRRNEKKYTRITTQGHKNPVTPCNPEVYSELKNLISFLEIKYYEMKISEIANSEM